MSEPKVTVGIATEDWMWTATVRGLLTIVRNPAITRFLMPQTTTIASARNIIVREFLKTGDEWLLFLDSDMVPRPDFVHRLTRWDRDLVSGVAVNRGRPHQVMAGWIDPDGSYWSIGELDPRAPLQAIDWCGMACFLARRKVFETLSDPWFEAKPDDIGEDSKFCAKAKAAGFEIFADTSCFVGHVGVEVMDLDWLTHSPAAITPLEGVA